MFYYVYHLVVRWKTFSTHYYFIKNSSTQHIYFKQF